MKWILLGVLSLGVLALVLSLSLTLGRNRSGVHPVVETDLGTVRGLYADDGDYSMFMGIPYAVVNESNPFGASTPHPKFEAVFDAFDGTALCPQAEEATNNIVGTLDCLHLHVYVPNTANPASKLPVLVWIHGGAFRYGSGGIDVHGPRFLVRHDVILVSINYRLGPYGFMCLDIPEVPGNQGLKDQMLALKWIHDNISAFNGDSSKITVMGESAGSVSIELLILSNKQRLYHQLILQSGSALLPGIIGPGDTTIPIRIASQLGLDTNNLNEAITFLAGIEPDKLIAATIPLSLRYRPCIEKELGNIAAIVTEHPEFLQPASVSGMPVLIGFNSHELLVPFVLMAPEGFRGLQVFHNQLAQEFNTDNDFDHMINMSRRFYIGDEEISQNVRWELIDFASDIVYNYPTQRSVGRFLASDAKVYQYMFSYSGGRNLVKMRFNMTEGGAAHADEIGYLFDLSFVTETPSAEDQLIIDRITTMWTNFVKYGEPTPEVTDLLPIKLNVATRDVVNYINIDTEMATGTRPYHSRLAFWDLFYEANYDKLIAHSYR